MKSNFPLTFLLILTCLFTNVALAKKNNLNTEILYPQDDMVNAYNQLKTVSVFNEWNSFIEATSQVTTEPVFDVDFQTSQVVIVDWGPKPNSAYQLKITGIKERELYIQVNVVYSQTLSNEECNFPSAIVRPLALIKIDSKKPVVIREHYQENRCKLPKQSPSKPKQKSGH
ncbi:hypothetical protein E2K93_04430 [Thalassotalea sp. HSM 43]|uniref:hypothetical protein n=1 Tax=Thalassotalea sp. HSM 43 TaxID=2552945 RepID=UPI0010815B0D|nr:hypothetical protein [Thalassotalea sp. HSM 43]QBY03672.1 hypothetical protein E2K93_04430 [Thalassotalea sp. HSM 43]